MMAKVTQRTELGPLRALLHGLEGRRTHLSDVRRCTVMSQSGTSVSCPQEPQRQTTSIRWASASTERSEEFQSAFAAQR